MAGTKSKIGDDYWRLRVFVGRRETGSPRFVSKNFRGGVRAADKALAKLVTHVDSGMIRSGAETVGDLLDRFLEHCEATGKSVPSGATTGKIKVVTPDGKVKTATAFTVT